VECIDDSEQMIEVALKRCGGKPWVCFRIGSATDLAVTSNSCDAVASVQVYEYVSDTPKALAELHRVLRPGGRAAIVSTDWPSIAWNSSDPNRMDRILDAFSEHCAHIALPRFLAPLIKAAGLSVSAQSVLPQFSVTYGPDRFGFQMAGLIASFVPGRRGVSQQDAAAWLDDLREIGERGDWFFNVNQYLFVIQKPA
jgi:ubiquinone/menaquinone biosynthesis C-methylase UbiE